MPRVFQFAPTAAAPPGGGGDAYSALGLIPGTPQTEVEEPFTAITIPNALNGCPWIYNDPWPPTGSSTVESVVDPAAPGSPNYWQWVYAQNLAGGNSPGRAVLENKNSFNGGAGWKHYGIGFHFKFSDPWHAHPSDNKMLYWAEVNGSGPTSHFYLNMRNDRVLDVLNQHPSTTAYRIPRAEDGGTYVNQTQITLGEWHTCVVLCEGNDNGEANGRLRVYLDAILQFDISGVRWNWSGDCRFYGLNLDPVWGGGGSNKSQEDYYMISNCRVVGSTGV